MKDKKKLILVISAALLVAAFFYFDLDSFLTLTKLKKSQNSLSNYSSQNPLLSIGVFFTLYVLTTALSLPGATVLTLAGGAIFGLVKGFIVVSFASTIGATLAFLLSRYLFKDYVQKKFGDKLSKFNEGIEKEGAFYLFTLRLVPAFPFFLINILMALTPIKTWTFYWISQLGMLAGTIAYVNAGTQLAEVDSLSGILSPALIGSFAVLGILPIISKKFVEFLRKKRNVNG